MKLGIIGSRSYPELHQVTEYVNKLPDDTIVVSGGAVGVDKTAITTAKSRGLQTQEIVPDLTKCSTNYEFTQAYYARNQQIVEACDRLVAFTEKTNGGTWDTIKRARKCGKPVDVMKPQEKPKGLPKPREIGKGPFHLRRVGFGSAALHLKKYFDPIAWADLLIAKDYTPTQLGKHMLPEFLRFFDQQQFGYIHAITQAPRNVKHLPNAHPMDVVCAGVAAHLQIPYIELFEPWEKSHRGRGAKTTTLIAKPCIEDYAEKIVFVLDDISATNTTLCAVMSTLRQYRVHGHAVVYVRCA